MERSKQKKMSSKLIALLMVLGTIVIGFGYFCWDYLIDHRLMRNSFALRLSEDEKYYIVDGYDGKNLEEAVIPSKYKGKPVSKIERVGKSSTEEKLGKLVIPNTIKYIENIDYGFEQFTTIEYEGTVAEWCSIDFAFEYDYDTDSYFTMEGVENFYCAGEEIVDLVIPEGVTKINDGAFRGLNFNSIRIADSVEYVGSYAFFNYDTEAQEIYIGKNVTTLGENFSALTKKYTVSTGNDNFFVIDDVLYTDYGYELVAYPGAKSDIIFTISKNIRTIRAYAFNGAYNLRLIQGNTSNWYYESNYGTKPAEDILDLLLDGWELYRR